MGEAIDAHYRGALVAPARVTLILVRGRSSSRRDTFVVRGLAIALTTRSESRVGVRLSPFTMRSAGTSERSRLATSLGRVVRGRSGPWPLMS